MDDLLVTSNGTIVLGKISEIRTTGRAKKASSEKYSNVLTVPSEELVLTYSTLQ